MSAQNKQTPPADEATGIPEVGAPIRFNPFEVVPRTSTSHTDRSPVASNTLVVEVASVLKAMENSAAVVAALPL
jgi:hypothetical protein